MTPQADPTAMAGPILVCALIAVLGTVDLRIKMGVHAPLRGFRAAMVPCDRCVLDPEESRWMT